MGFEAIDTPPIAGKGGLGWFNEGSKKGGDVSIADAPRGGGGGGFTGRVAPEGPFTRKRRLIENADQSCASYQTPPLDPRFEPLIFFACHRLVSPTPDAICTAATCRDIQLSLWTEIE